MRKTNLIIVMVLIALLTCCSTDNRDPMEDLENRIVIDSDFISTEYNLDGYPIVIHNTDGLCDEWYSSEFSKNGYNVIIINRCGDLGGVPYLDIAGYAFDIQSYIKNYYEYSIDDNEVLTYIGVEYSD